MIKEIFLPEQWGNYFVASRRIIGFEFHRNSVHATKIVLHGTSITIESSMIEPIGNGPSEARAERMQDAVKTLYAHLGPCDEIRVALASEYVFFRTLTVPFSDHEKIRMMVAFEIESQLPFALSEAVIDFIILNNDSEQASCTVLVSAVPKKHIAEYRTFFDNTPIVPHVIVVDMFAVYGTYRMFLLDQRFPAALFCDIEMHATRLMLIHNGALELIRTVPFGVITAAKHIAKKLSINTEEAVEQIMRLGITKTGSSAHNQAVTESFAQLADAITLTLSSLEQKPAITLFLIGPYHAMIGLGDFLCSTLNMRQEPIDSALFLQGPISFVQEKKNNMASFMISMSTAIPSPLLTSYNVLQQEFKPALMSRSFKQIVASFILAVTFIFSFFGIIFWQRYQLKSELATTTHEALSALSERFPRVAEENIQTLDEAIDVAEEILTQEEKTWFKFSRSSHRSPLEYLFELTKLIDKQQIGFRLDSLTIDENAITMAAHVRNHDALSALEHALRESKLFKSIEPQDNPDFVMKIMLKNSIHGGEQ